MFRKGGPINDGIMTGIVDRENHAEDPFVGGTDQFPYMAKPTQSSPQMNLPDLKSMTKENIDLLLEAAGPRGGYDPLTTLLLEYGPQAAIENRGGSTLRNLIAAGEKPIANLIASKQKEDDFLRSIRTQATGAAMKRRSELEQADIDNRFREKLANKQISANQDIATKQIAATMEEARLDHERALQRQAEKSEADYETRSKLLKEGKALDRMTASEKIQEYAPGYAEEYDDDQTKGLRRATFEFDIRNKIAENFGESKVGGHINIDVSNQDKVNNTMRKRIKAGGAEKIYYNVNDGKTYVLIQEGKQAVLKPVDLAGGKEQITEFTETTLGGETVKKNLETLLTLMKNKRKNKRTARRI